VTIPVIPPEIEAILRPLLEKLIAGKGRDGLTKRFAKAAPAVVARLEKDGVTQFGDRQAIRSALFLLWKSQVKNGHLADLVRDVYDDKVLEVLAGKTFASLAEMVAAVAAAQVEIIF
jgi:hypothetical protein